MRLLPDDEYTGGVLSQTLVNTWNARRASKQYYVTHEQLRRLHRVLEDSKDKIFEEVVETLNIPFDALPPSVDEKGIFITGLIKDTTFEGVDLGTNTILSKSMIYIARERTVPRVMNWTICERCFQCFSF